MIDNPVRGRFNAWLLTMLDDYMHNRYEQVKTGLLASAPDTVVELGAGPGTNMRYLRPGTRVLAVEPNRHMHETLRATSERFGIDLELCTCAGESMAIASESVDFVFGSLVLCTVDQPAQVLAEIVRVLRPKGRFVCLEHVQAPPGSAVRALQHLVRTPWRWVFEGCDLCRDTVSILRDAGFSSVEVTPFKFSTAFVPLRYQVKAICVK